MNSGAQLNGSILENVALTWIEKLGNAIEHGLQHAPGEPPAERDLFDEVMPAELRLMWVFGVVWSSKALKDETGSGKVGLPSPCRDA